MASVGKGAIQVEPRQGYYVNFDVHTTYSIPFTVRNVAREMCTVRFTPPSNQRVFRINTTSVRLAPGLTHVIEAEFTTHEPRDYQDSFVVFTAGESITVPLVAKCCPDLEFPTTVNFGRVERNRRGLSKLLPLTNRGRREMRVSVKPLADERAVVQVSPAVCVVPPLSTANVYVELLRLDVGKHQQRLQISVASEEEEQQQQQQLPEVMVEVDVVDCRGALIDPHTGDELHALNFAKTYAGTKRVMGLEVRNESEQQVSFAFRASGEAGSGPFGFKPQHGRLGPHETRHITAVFAPPVTHAAKGWSSNREKEHASQQKYEALFSLLFVETENTHTVRVTGTSTTTVAWISQPVIDFGECPMNDHRDVVVQVHNGHEDMPLHFLFPRVAHYTITPMEGKVPPSGSCDVRLTFRPRRLGTFKDQIAVVFNETERQTLEFSGIATTLAPQPKTVGGIDKLPEDFESSLKMAKPLRDEPRRTLTNRSITAMAATATTNTVLSAVDIGMVPAEGLEPPEPELPAVTFKTKSVNGFALGRGGDHFSPVTLDAKTLIRRVFKEAPTNAAERRDCRRELQPMDLLRIAAPIKVLDYHRVTVGSTSTKTFFLYNGTSASVLAVMPMEETHLSFSPQSQVIPAGRAAAFDVNFYSSAVQTYQQIVQITINGHHTLRFTLQADVVPVEVSLSRDEVTLHFVDFSEDPVAHASVTLSNLGNSDAVYKWVLPDGPFTISPMSGSISPMNKVTAQLMFSPPQGVLNAEAKAELHVKGGTAVKVLNLKGVIAPTLCVWGGSATGNEYTVELSGVPAGVSTTATVILQNRGRNSAFFSLDSLPDWVTITPVSGRIGAGESEEITVAVQHDSPGLLQCVVPCCVRGMKRPLKLHLCAMVSVAPLSILSPERQNGEILLVFDTIYVGTEKALPVRFSNTGDVAAVIYVDLQQHAEYTLQCPENSAASLEWRGRGDIVPGVMYITIPSHCEATVLFVFKPKIAGTDERFFVTWRHVGAGEANPLPPLAIAGCAVLSRVRLQREVLDFPLTVVGAPAVPMMLTIENTSSEVVHWELFLDRGLEDESYGNRPNSNTNNKNKINNINNNAKNIDGNDVPFHISPDSGTLGPHASQLLHATFMPTLMGERKARYSVFLDGDLKHPCAQVQVTGFATLPRITCDRSELIFPAVPLNVNVVETMYIVNDGFDSIEVYYKSVEPGPLTVTFPRGSVAKSSGCIPVRVEFCCPKPVTFSSSITFTSDKGESLIIPITGTAVNSYITTAPYVVYQRGRSHIDTGTTIKSIEDEWVHPLLYREDAPVTNTNAVNNTEGVRKQTESLQSEQNPFSFVDTIGLEMYSHYTIENLRLWLNYNVLKESVDDLIGALQSTDGRILLEAVYRISGKRPKKIHALTSKEKSFTLLETLTSYIKSRGGCLSDIRLPYLLTYEAYCRYQESYGMEAISSTAFSVRANHAWITVVLQFIRVLYLPKLDLTSTLKMYPGMKTYIPQPAWSSAPFQTALLGSNVFSPEESLLLRWVAHNLQQCVEEKLIKGSNKIIRRFEDFRDCLGLIASILLYVPSVSTRLSLDRLVKDPTTSVDMENNATVLLSALSYLGVPLRATARDILDYSGIDWLLLAATLFMYLPRFIPTTVISLEGKLLAPMTRTVDVTNTSSAARNYTVDMSNSVFRAVPQELSVDSGSTAKLLIEVTLRFNRRAEGLCVLIDTSTTLMTERAPIVLRLAAVPNNEPLRVIHIQTPLYTILNHDIQVESPFPQNCVATLRMAQEYKNDGPYPEGEFGKTLQGAFSTSAGVLPFRSGESTRLGFQFAPCARGKYEARITFHDEHQGEFSYIVIGTCTLPKPVDKSSVRGEAGEECSHTLLLKLQNTPFERMLRTFEDQRRAPATRGTKASIVPDLAGIPYSVSFVNETGVGPNPFFRGPETVMFTGGESLTTLTYFFVPKYLGEYNGFILLSSKYDVRSIQITGKCVPTGEKGILRFACPARQCITQGVPVVNNSNENWLISATLEGTSFSGPKELRVPRGKQRDYPLRYNPAWITSDKGGLTLYNNETGERRVYTLVGEAEEPLSEDTITVECRARERRTEVLTVPDINGADAMYNVETDLPFAHGEASVLVRRGTTAKYALVLHPMMGGTYVGTVVCRAPNGRYAWYAVTVIVSSPEKEGTVDIKTDARTPVTADVSINNPIDKPLQFTVRRYGSGLFGENSVMVEASAAAVYSFMFVPSQTGSFNGRLVFCNDVIGEFWYDLNIIVEEAAPEEIKFESEIGVPDVMQVRIPNNTSVERSLYVSNTNPRNFSTAPMLLTIPAYSELTVDVIYTPTIVGQKQEAMLKLSNQDLGEWRYACTGVGLPPAESEPVECVCEVSGRLAVMLKFKNPFEAPMIPEATLVSNCEEGYYTLAAAQKQSVAPGAEASIALTYAPKTVGHHEATVLVRPVTITEKVQDITWRFPLKGLAEWRCPNVFLNYHCVARRQLEETVTLPAPGVSEEDKDRITVELELERKQEYSKTIQSSFQAKVLTFDANKGVISLNLRFAPLRPFVATADLVLRCERGATWRYPINLDAVRAEYDDILTITAALHTASAVTFDMYNAFPHSSPFSAYFTPESSRDLSVTVTHGVLRPFIVGQKNPGAATPLQVQFAPSARVPQVEGTLIVDTEEMQWSFKVVGKLESRSVDGKKVQRM
ncbi:uncharacterized protein TM35_000192770 [Trypanosoma theileri]|uniref:Abnormal spindle-like microcephaly-associated protein ASH domain-containing protein n=1 Tax=Trypanosoma theileri TaxID=67003 RepID=A0A1X0NU70_9TRYP|nr:uncharacterized protein TM35_000192770 [Trypanosoma theileri]ORC88033.1 hypothetical protein TM35_000192770 [Trypanosoma theileri]